MIAPLAAIVETLKPKKSEIRRLGDRHAAGRARRYRAADRCRRGARLAIRTDRSHRPASCLLVENEVGGCAALLVDAIQGQRQVVIKSLEQNFQRVESIAAATILGDGRVALILDVDAIVGERRVDAERTWQARLKPWRASRKRVSDMQESVGQELISFRIGEQEFCVDIMAVREIRGWTPATSVAAGAELCAWRHQPARRRACRSSILVGPPWPWADSEPSVRNVIIVVRIGSAPRRPAG